MVWSVIMSMLFGLLLGAVVGFVLGALSVYVEVFEMSMWQFRNARKKWHETVNNVEWYDEND